MKALECTPAPHGCRRCLLPPTDGPAFLLLGPRNPNTRDTLRAAFVNGNVLFTEQEALFVLPLDGPFAASNVRRWCEQLLPITQQDTQAVVFHGDTTCWQSVLRAFFQAQPLGELLDRLQHEWVRAVLADGLFSVFHPIVAAETEAVFGYEALVRGRSLDDATIGAGAIINACHRLDLQHVLDQRARQSAIRHAAALQIPDAAFFINFLPNTIYDPEICLRTTMETAEECHMPLHRLVFEVVETEQIPDMKRLKRILDYYRARGVQTAIDDLGAGFASLQYLEALRPDFAKIDRQIVVDADHNVAVRRELDASIAYARQRGIRVIAEGIETETQRQICVEAGADFLQGFLFARPANPPEAVRGGLAKAA